MAANSNDWKGRSSRRRIFDDLIKMIVSLSIQGGGQSISFAQV